MFALIDLGLDIVNGIFEPMANKKRLLKAREEFGEDELIPMRLGRQNLLIAAPTAKVLQESGLWGMLLQAAERGDQLDSIFEEP